MKTIITLTVISLLFSNKIISQTSNNKYDSVLAKNLNADAYGMKKYILVMLKTGSASATTSKTAQDSIFNGHMQNIKRLASLGKLILAGPLGENDKKYEGIFLFSSESMVETKQLLETDPAIKSKLLDPEVFLWYGSAAVMQVPAIHERIQKKSF